MHRLEMTQKIPVALNEAWDFFSSPENLSVITPSYMGFRILGDLPKVMYEGQFINYKVSPMLGITLNWTTEITHIRSGEFFVDEQRSGPYKVWHHEHHFREIDGGVEIHDLVNYELPFGFLGKGLHNVVVKKKLDEIFDFRRKKIESLFGKIS